MTTTLGSAGSAPLTVPGAARPQRSSPRVLRMLRLRAALLPRSAVGRGWTRSRPAVRALAT